MDSFWAGFEKAAKEKKKSHGIGTALGVSAATTAGLSAANAISDSARDAAEATQVDTSKTIKHLKQQMKPGDIIMQRVPRGKSTKLMGGITTSEFAQLGTGSPYYHTAIYKGNGKVYNMTGSEKNFELSDLKGMAEGNDIKVYRPNATKEEVQRALDFSKKLKKAKYQTGGGAVRQGLGHVSGISPMSAAAKSGPNARHTCTTSVTGAYPNQFPKAYTSPRDMRKAPGMRLVGRFGNVPMSVGEKAIVRGVHPYLKNLKWGVGAGAAALGAHHLYNYTKRRMSDAGGEKQ